jgi:hypothetical protein
MTFGQKTLRGIVKFAAVTMTSILLSAPLVGVVEVPWSSLTDNAKAAGTLDTVSTVGPFPTSGTNANMPVSSWPSLAVSTATTATSWTTPTTDNWTIPVRNSVIPTLSIRYAPAGSTDSSTWNTTYQAYGTNTKAVSVGQNSTSGQVGQFVAESISSSNDVGLSIQLPTGLSFQNSPIYAVNLTPTVGKVLGLTASTISMAQIYYNTGTKDSPNWNLNSPGGINASTMALTSDKAGTQTIKDWSKITGIWIDTVMSKAPGGYTSYGLIGGLQMPVDGTMTTAGTYNVYLASDTTGFLTTNNIASVYPGYYQDFMSQANMGPGNYSVVQPITVQPAGQIAFTHNYRTDGTGTSVTSSASSPYQGTTFVTDDVISNTSTTDVTNEVFRVGITPGVNRTISFVNDAGEDVSSYVGSPVFTYYDTSGSVTTDVSQATRLTISGLTFKAGTSFHIKISRTATTSMAATSRIISEIGTYNSDGNFVASSSAPMDYWRAVVPLPETITNPVALYQNNNGTYSKVGDGSDLTGTLVEGSTTSTSNGDQSALYHLDVSALTVPSDYTLVSKYSDTLYAWVKQVYSSSGKWMNYSSVVTTDVSMAADSTSVGTMMINGVSTDLYPYAVTLDQYNADENSSQATAANNSVNTYAPVTLEVSTSVSGNIQFTDKDGNQVGALVAFENEKPGTTVDVSTLSAPKNYDFNSNLGDTSLTNDTYQSGTVKVYVTRVTDDKYDASNVTTQTNQGLLNQGMQIVNAPDYTGSDRVGSLTSTLKPTADLSYVNMYGNALSLYMSATSLTGALLNNNLQVSTITVPDDSGQVVNIYDGTNGTAIPGNGAKVGTISKKTGTFALPDMTVNLSFTSFADTYKGKINYMLVDDSGTVTTN